MIGYTYITHTTCTPNLTQTSHNDKNSTTTHHINPSTQHTHTHTHTHSHSYEHTFTHSHIHPRTLYTHVHAHITYTHTRTQIISTSGQPELPEGFFKFLDAYAVSDKEGNNEMKTNRRNMQKMQTNCRSTKKTHTLYTRQAWSNTSNTTHHYPMSAEGVFVIF